MPERTANLPSLSRPDSVPETITRRDRLMPVLFAGGLLAAGAVLLKIKPHFGEVPRASRFGDMAGQGRFRRAASATRDQVEAFAPTNVTDQIGRSLMLGGAALLLTRVLDEVAAARQRKG
ncbi:hypothetical protein [Salipiger sp.]|uniref:hypothetical protein n=1 Tax=Salipiger sp. TaxID=2078585 RepID=UPI003A97FE9E